jgi:hypothetical protein
LDLAHPARVREIGAHGAAHSAVRPWCPAVDDPLARHDNVTMVMSNATRAVERAKDLAQPDS